MNLTESAIIATMTIIVLVGSIIALLIFVIYDGLRRRCEAMGEKYDTLEIRLHEFARLHDFAHLTKEIADTATNDMKTLRDECTTMWNTLNVNSQRSDLDAKYIMSQLQEVLVREAEINDRLFRANGEVQSCMEIAHTLTEDAKAEMQRENKKLVREFYKRMKTVVQAEKLEELNRKLAFKQTIDIIRVGIDILDKIAPIHLPMSCLTVLPLNPNTSYPVIKKFLGLTDAQCSLLGFDLTFVHEPERIQQWVEQIKQKVEQWEDLPNRQIYEVVELISVGNLNYDVGAEYPNGSPPQALTGVFASINLQDIWEDLPDYELRVLRMVEARVKKAVGQVKYVELAREILGIQPLVMESDHEIVFDDTDYLIKEGGDEEEDFQSENISPRLVESTTSALANIAEEEENKE